MKNMKITKKQNILKKLNKIFFLHFLKCLIDFKISVFKSDLENDIIRNYMEQNWINMLNINKTRCINKLIKRKKFIFK